MNPSNDNRTVKDVISTIATWTEEQQRALLIMMQLAAHSAEGEYTATNDAEEIAAAIESMTEDQKTVMYAMVGMCLPPADPQSS